MDLFPKGFAFTLLHSSLALRAGIFAACVAVLAGCQDEPQITSYTIPKEPAVNTAPALTETSDEETVPTRTLGAIVPLEEQTWFFKLMGPEEPVAAEAERFNQFVQSIRFTANGTPEWTLPEAWREQPGSGMRFSTIQIPTAETPLELTVIPLPTGPDAERNLLDNVNRWRTQLHLPEIAADDLPDHTEPVALDGATATVVNFSGRASQTSTRMPPFAR